MPDFITQEERQRIYTIKTHILHHLQQELSIGGLAKRAGLSKRKLQEGFRQEFGLPIGNYVHESRMLFGYFLLTHTDKPIKEIAYLSGYRFTKNFMTAIRKHFGNTARTIRTST